MKESRLALKIKELIAHWEEIASDLRETGESYPATNVRHISKLAEAKELESCIYALKVALQDNGSGCGAVEFKYRCETCQNEGTIHIEPIGWHFCESCLKKIDERIAEFNAGKVIICPDCIPHPTTPPSDTASASQPTPAEP